MLHCFIEFLKRNKQLILYSSFGFCTTLINTACYAILYNYLDIGNVSSTVIAWLVAVIFAFVTNKILVFKSRTTDRKEVLSEIVSFFGWRVATGILDVVIMFITVDMMQWNSLVWKLVSNVLVIVINYVASKLLIFKKTKKDE